MLTDNEKTQSPSCNKNFSNVRFHPIIIGVWQFCGCWCECDVWFMLRLYARSFYVILQQWQLQRQMFQASLSPWHLQFFSHNYKKHFLALQVISSHWSLTRKQWSPSPSDMPVVVKQQETPFEYTHKPSFGVYVVLNSGTGFKLYHKANHLFL